MSRLKRKEKHTPEYSRTSTQEKKNLINLTLNQACLIHFAMPHLFNILRTNQVTTQVHHVGNGDIRQNVYHPQCVVQRGDVGVIIGVWEEIAWEQEFVPEQIAHDRHILDLANVVGAILRISLLPVPPQTVQVCVVKEEEWIRWAGALFHDVLAI